MYGLLLESIADCIRRKYGDSAWDKIRSKAGITHLNFGIHKKYSETVIPRIAKAACEVLDVPQQQLMEFFGCAFVSFVGQYGYDRIMRVLGRHLRDFLNGLDNLHEYLRFSYPKLKPPSFFCEHETKEGLTLHYRSKRKGFVYYVMGQITQVAKAFYDTHLEIELISQEESMDLTHVIMKLHFQNTAFKEPSTEMDEVPEDLPISSDMFFDVFPFHIVFNRGMVIKNIGSGLDAIMPHIRGQSVDEMFMLTRPMVEFSMENVLTHTNNVFELTSVDGVRRMTDIITSSDDMDDDDELDDRRKRLKMKGQMMYMSEWDAILFLGTPMMENLEKMFETGLYINDLSMHDSSRDLVLAGTQQQAELKMALDQEQQKSKKLEESMKKLDTEMKRTDQLLYQMIPKAVADRLRQGEPAMNTCQVFASVTIMFSDVVGFTQICSQITPMEVVDMLNLMYTKFDGLTEKHRVYKVETIGDAYMVVSGAPIVTKFHAVYIADMAFDMMDTMRQLPDPSKPGDHLKIRLGLHTGKVVGGVVGMKMPRYCLFGESVYTANAMESTGEPMRIHCSSTTKEALREFPYIFEMRGELDVKGKIIEGHWLVSKDTSAKAAKLPRAALTADSQAMEGNVMVGEDYGQGRGYRPPPPLKRSGKL